jgi:hypothetical protein
MQAPPRYCIFVYNVDSATDVNAKIAWKHLFLTDNVSILLNFSSLLLIQKIVLFYFS